MAQEKSGFKLRDWLRDHAGTDAARAFVAVYDSKAARQKRSRTRAGTKLFHLIHSAASELASKSESDGDTLMKGILTGEQLASWHEHHFAGIGREFAKRIRSDDVGFFRKLVEYLEAMKKVPSLERKQLHLTHADLSHDERVLECFHRLVDRIERLPTEIEFCDELEKVRAGFQKPREVTASTWKKQCQRSRRDLGLHKLPGPKPSQTRRGRDTIPGRIRRKK